VIEVRELRKEYKVHRRQPGLGASIRSLFRRRYEAVKAVDGISFSVGPGERVGFLGPNGAGKTTTLKVLSGLLHPSAGEVRVAGFVPARRETSFLQSITLVMGQKQQLLWDLPPSETFALNRAIYEIPRPEFEVRIRELVELLDLGGVIDKPTRQLSLGERMKCELAASLVHRPRVLFLDEPTIGLDVTMQATVREFIRSYNERHGATVLLTSHYMDDVLALCPRVVVIDKGRLIYDGDLRQLSREVRPDKRVVVRLGQPVPETELSRFGALVSHADGQAVYRVPGDQVANVVGKLLSSLPVTDLTVEEPPLEEIMSELFQGRRAAAP
jgi:ABC-2 type transport system ATP-binding protein